MKVDWTGLHQPNPNQMSSRTEATLRFPPQLRQGRPIYRRAKQPNQALAEILLLKGLEIRCKL
jgi:hypothetical protein